MTTGDLMETLETMKLYRRVAKLELALESLVTSVGNMRVPQTIADAGLQILTISPALENAKKILQEK